MRPPGRDKEERPGARRMAAPDKLLRVLDPSAVTPSGARINAWNPTRIRPLLLASSTVGNGTRAGKVTCPAPFSSSATVPRSL